MLSQIQKLAAAANVAIGPETVSLYAIELATLSREQLDTAVSRTIREWDRPSQMPMIPFVLARSGADVKLLAEQAWELAWKLVKRDWYADGIGWLGGAEKKLTPAIQYAIRQCGGEHRMVYADEETFPFVRRDFLHAHERFVLEDGEQVRLTAGEARQFLRDLREQEHAALPEIPEGTIGEPTFKREPRPQTREELEARMVELRRQAEQMRQQAATIKPDGGA